MTYNFNQILLFKRGKLTENAGATVERTWEHVYERPHEPLGPRLNHKLGVDMYCLTVLILVGHGDEHGDTLLNILPRDVSERIALRVETSVRVYRPDDLTALVTAYLDL
jgi:NAD(P)H-hydrate repair Nnr-like enzyme with NAD(P)H-hydrate epimerase domain